MTEGILSLRANLILNFGGALYQLNVNLRFQHKINNTTAIEIGITTSRILPVPLFNIHIFFLEYYVQNDRLCLKIYWSYTGVPYQM